MYFTCTLFDMGYGDALALLQDVLKGRLEKAVAHLVPGEQKGISICIYILISKYALMSIYLLISIYRSRIDKTLVSASDYSDYS